MSWREPRRPVPTPVNQGGTGATTAVAARANLGITGGIYSVVSTEAELTTALAAGDKLIFVDTAITLTANKNVDESCELRVAPGITLALDAYALIVAAAKRLALSGLGGGAITWDRSSGQAVQLGTGAALDVQDLTLTNSSSSATTYLATAAEDQSYQNVTLTPGNVNNGGILSSGALFISNLTIVGPGTSVQRALSITGGESLITNLRLEGALWQSNVEAIFVDTNDELALSNFSFENSTASAPDFSFSGRCRIANVIVSTNAANIILDDEANLHNVYTDSELSVGEDCSVAGGYCRHLDFDSNDHARVTDLTVRDSISNLGTYNQLTAVHLTFATATITVADDDVGLMNVKTGAANGLSATIVVNAGSDRTRIVGCVTDAAISDSGTGTVTAGNAVM